MDNLREVLERVELREEPLSDSTGEISGSRVSMGYSR